MAPFKHENSSNLLDQVEQRYWSDSVFICHHSQLEQHFWPEIVGFEEEPDLVSLEFGLVSQEPDFREQVPRNRYPEMQSIILDHLGMHKLAALAEKARKVNPHGDDRRSLIISSSPSELWNDEKNLDWPGSRVLSIQYIDNCFQRAKKETNLSGVTCLELFMYNGHSPWSKRQADGTIAILPISDLEVQKQLSYVFECMPSLKEIKIVRGFGDEFLRERQTCVWTKGSEEIVKQSAGTAIAADLEKADKLVEKYLRRRLAKQNSGLLTLFGRFGR